MDTRLIDGVGLWCEHLSDTQSGGRPALFLDRDGVIVDEVGYLARAEDVHLIEGAIAAIRYANSLGVRVAVVTNQSGIGRGFFTWSDFACVQGRLIEALAAHEAHLDLVLACAYHPKAIGRLAVDNHNWRKPNEGMITTAAKLLGANLFHSLIVGDKRIDLEAGNRAGIGEGMLVRTGHGLSESARFNACELSPMRVSIQDDASAIVPWLRKAAACSFTVPNLLG